MTDNGPTSPMPEFERCDAPPAVKRGRQGIYDPLFAELKAMPGQWARWQESTGAKASSCSQYLRKLGLESASRTIDGKIYVYARYVGGEQ